MPVLITRYRVSRHYLWAGVAALALTAFSGWLSLKSPFCWIATFLFLASAFLVLYLAARPPIEIYESHLKVGRKAIPWMQIRRLDRGAQVPLIVRLSLADKTKIHLVYPGDPDTSASLLRELRRNAREALIDGVPYRQFWGESMPPQDRKQLAAPERPPLLLPEDEDEVERMFQRLKSVGRLDQKTSAEDK